MGVEPRNAHQPCGHGAAPGAVGSREEGLHDHGVGDSGEVSLGSRAPSAAAAAATACSRRAVPGRSRRARAAS